MRTRKNIVSLIAAGCLLLALPGTAGAPKVFGLPNALGGCEEAGVGSGSYAGGSLTVASFEVKDDALVAHVELLASCRINEENRPQTEAVGTAAADVLEVNSEHLVISLLGSVGGKDTTFAIDSALEVVAEKSSKSLVKKVERDPEMSVEDLGSLLNRYLGVKKSH